MEKERCENCQCFTTLYIPPRYCFDNIREALNADTKSIRVCSLFINEGEVMWLGQGEEVASGICEEFRRKKVCDDSK